MEVKLIKLVKSYECLYNTTLESYRRRETKMIAWATVSHELGLPTKECESKWKSLRDKYRRERKRYQEENRSDTGQSTTNKWCLFELLQFLEPFTAQRCTISNIVDPEEYSVIYESVSPSTTDTETRSPISDTNGKTKKRKRNEAESADEGLDKILAAMSSIGTDIQMDEDEMFLLSLVGELRSLTPQNKIRFKIEAMELLQRLRFSESSFAGTDGDSAVVEL